jgi:membrane protein required for colicin V production
VSSIEALIFSIVAAGMNWLDYALLLILGLSVLHGLAYGALRMASPIVSFALAIYSAFLWHARAAAMVHFHFGTSPAASQVVGYITVFLLTFVLAGMAAQRIIGLAEVVNLNLVDRLAGAAFGGVIGALIAGLNIVVLTAILPPNYPLLQNSELAPEIISYDRRLLEFVPSQFRDLYQDKRDRLVRYWAAKNNPPVTATGSSH